MSEPTERADADRDGDTDRGDVPGSDPGGRGGDHGGRPCPRCGEPLVHRHCKYVCPVHGVVYDCSDTFY
ncbi:hypothetical protein DJ70_15920 [Halorubrum halodurans]|uniref:Small CPxCG-related zinc finger protein n=1 Tax=Halorubrum halodurans TaxID=1383851 RepID=A0A256IAU2_9EURY|nr:HVO_2523 family zinc finger protein [Halorubrum halodurans]OYR53649.1 hypothetical protein DJ70_15920 [Halorubrum halodurans]